MKSTFKQFRIIMGVAIIFVSPMLLQKIDVPSDDTSITELKFDGIRLILSKHEDKTKLYTRHGTEVTNRFTELCQNDLPDGTILDGELVVLDERGKPSLELIMSRFHTSRALGKLPVTFVVFDIIKYKNAWLNHIKLIKRKEILSEALPSHPNMTELKWIDGNAPEYFKVVQERGLEGIVVKNPNSRYYFNKRSSDWEKIINYQYIEGLVIGYRKNEFGLIIQSFDGKAWGIMEHMPVKNRREFFAMSRQQKINESKEYVYLSTPFPVKIKYRHFTSKGKLHIPVFNGWLI